MRAAYGYINVVRGHRPGPKYIYIEDCLLQRSVFVDLCKFNDRALEVDVRASEPEAVG